MINKLFNLLLRFRPAAKYLLALWIITILILSSLPASAFPHIKIERIIVRIDHLIHFIEYSILSWLTFYTFSSRRLTYTSKKLIIIFSALLLFSIADESHQLFIPSRSFSLYDLIADFIGIITAATFFYLVTRVGLKRNQKENFGLDY